MPVLSTNIQYVYVQLFISLFYLFFFIHYECDWCSSQERALTWRKAQQVINHRKVTVSAGCSNHERIEIGYRTHFLVSRRNTMIQHFQDFLVPKKLVSVGMSWLGWKMQPSCSGCCIMSFSNEDVYSFHESM